MSALKVRKKSRPYCVPVVPDSSVGIATPYGVKDPGIESHVDPSGRAV